MGMNILESKEYARLIIDGDKSFEAGELYEVAELFVEAKNKYIDAMNFYVTAAQLASSNDDYRVYDAFKLVNTCRTKISMCMNPDADVQYYMDM